MKLIGKTSIHPALFYSGKFAGYFTWFILLLSLVDINIFNPNEYGYAISFSIIIMTLGLVIASLSLLDLGPSTRLGLPDEQTDFIEKGMYRYSRNPMYVGFNLITIAAGIGTLNIIIIILGLYSILIYHKIIIAEEKFMEERFGNNYVEYKNRVRRYV